MVAAWGQLRTDEKSESLITPTSPSSARQPRSGAITSSTPMFRETSRRRTRPRTTIPDILSRRDCRSSEHCRFRNGRPGISHFGPSQLTSPCGLVALAAHSVEATSGSNLLAMRIAIADLTSQRAAPSATLPSSPLRSIPSTPPFPWPILLPSSFLSLSHSSPELTKQ